MSKHNKVDATIDNCVTEEPVKEIVKEPVINIGKVVTPLLNVREDSKANAAIKGTVTEGTELKIDMSCRSTKFYKITTPTGVEGFCMKEFIELV